MTGRAAAAGAFSSDGGVERAVARISEEVRRRGDAALRALTLRHDGALRRSIEVRERERRAGADAVAPETRAALRFAARRIAAFARRQRASLRPFRIAADGVVLEQRILPVESVGVYAPGGRYPLCSTVLMGAIPARVAGCRRVILCSPPRPDGSLPPEVLAAARVAGVDRVFALGGAQAIAAMAHGTRSVPSVDLIVGPGNRYVAAAKARLAGRVGIDCVAGPTELLMIADGAADPERVASDLLGQAEHDPEARLWLVTLGRRIARAIRRALGRRAMDLPPSNRATASRALSRMRVIACRSLAKTAAVANRIAPEHLSVQTASPRDLVPRLRSYGSLFLGGASPVALGDYVTGPNHVLPTSGAARHTGGLSALRFLRVVTVQEVSERGARRLAPAAGRLAAVEGLAGHRASVALRDGGRGRRAVLFDFNGVLMDDEEYHFRAYREVLRPLGISLTRARYDARYLAFDDRGALRAILVDAGRPASRIDALVRSKRRAFRRLCARRVRVEPETADLVRALARRVPVAVVSGAARAEILHALRGARLTPAFRTIVAAEDVRRCKPDPEGYRLALRRLGLGRGTGCLAIEDSPGGIHAARAAGLEVLGIATTYAPALLRRAGAARVTRTIASLTAAEILDGRADPSSRRRSRIRTPRRRA